MHETTETTVRLPSVLVTEGTTLGLPSVIVTAGLESFGDLLKETYPIPRRLLGQSKRTTLEIAPTTVGTTSSKNLCWDSDNGWKQSTVFISKRTITPNTNTARKPWTKSSWPSGSTLTSMFWWFSSLGEGQSIPLVVAKP